MARQQHIDALEQKRLQIADDVERLAAQAKGARRTITQQAKDSAMNAANDVKGAVQRAKDDAKNIVSTARSDTTETAKIKARAAARAADPRKVIREQPMAALGVGVGLGVLLTMFLLPRRRKYRFQGYPVQGRYAVENRYITRNDLP